MKLDDAPYGWNHQEELEGFFAKVEFGQIVIWDRPTGPAKPILSSALVAPSIEVPTDSQVTGEVVSRALSEAIRAGDFPAGTVLRENTIYEPAEFLGRGLVRALSEEHLPMATAYLVPEDEEDGEPFAWVILTLAR